MVKGKYKGGIMIARVLKPLADEQLVTHTVAELTAATFAGGGLQRLGWLSRLRRDIRYSRITKGARGAINYKAKAIKKRLIRVTQILTIIIGKEHESDRDY